MAKSKTVTTPRKLVSTIIDATPGVVRAVHVFTPALQHRLATAGSELPVMALRSSLHEYNLFKLYQRIELLGPSSMDPLFDKPLSGTGGRGVAILFTEFALRVWHFDDETPAVIDSKDGRNPQDVLKDVLAAYVRNKF
jgi:hypothetical protein